MLGNAPVHDEVCQVRCFLTQLRQHATFDRALRDDVNYLDRFVLPAPVSPVFRLYCAYVTPGAGEEHHGPGGGQVQSCSARSGSRTEQVELVRLKRQPGLRAVRGLDGAVDVPDGIPPLLSHRPGYPDQLRAFRERDNRPRPDVMPVAPAQPVELALALVQLVQDVAQHCALPARLLQHHRDVLYLLPVLRRPHVLLDFPGN